MNEIMKSVRNQTNEGEWVEAKNKAKMVTSKQDQIGKTKKIGRIDRSKAMNKG